MLKKNNVEKILIYGLIVLFVGQFFVLCFFNLTQLKYHIGFDVSINYLKAMEIAKQGTIFIDHWVDTSCLLLESSVPLAAPLFYLTGNIFFSYGLINILLLLAMLWLLHSIMETLGYSRTAQLICANMFVCPYLGGDFNNAYYLMWFDSVLCEAQFYGGRILVILMLIKLALDCERGKERKIYIILTELLVFWVALSGGLYMIVTIIAPLLLYYFYKTVARGRYSFNYNQNKHLIWLALAFVLTLMGRYVQARYLGFSSGEADINLIGINEFWYNLGMIITGYVKLFGGMGEVCKALSAEGIFRFCGLLICMISLVGVWVKTKRFANDVHQNMDVSMLVCVFFFNIIMYSLVYTGTRYGGTPSVSARYLIPVMILALIMSGSLYDVFEKKIRNIGVMIIVCALLFMNIYGDVTYLTTQNEYDESMELVDEIDKLNVPVVYVCDSALKGTERNLRVLDSKRVYKFLVDGYYNATVHWGDYTYYDDVALVQGANALVTTEEYFNAIPDYIRKQYKVVKEWSGYNLYFAKKNKIDLVSGITGDYCMDYPTSIDTEINNGYIDDEGCFVSNGNAGIALEGAKSGISAGTYDFTISYSVVSAKYAPAEFEVTINSGNDIVGSISLNEGKTKATISDVIIPEDSVGFSYRIRTSEGTIIKINSFEAFRHK